MLPAAGLPMPRRSGLEPAAVLGLRRCTARATRRTENTTAEAWLAIARHRAARW